MARIRTIKPEFWTDEKVVALSFASRLLYIGIWNFCDEEGRGEYSPNRLKMQILPADDADMSALMGELMREKLVQIYAVDNRPYYQVAGFVKHQKIDRRLKSRHPPNPNIEENAPTNPNSSEFPSTDQGSSIKYQVSRNKELKPADAGGGKYAFEGEVVKLSHEHFREWSSAFENLYLRAELLARDAYLASDRASDQDRKNWFISTSKYLANRNSEAAVNAKTPASPDLDITGMPLREVG